MFAASALATASMQVGQVLPPNKPSQRFTCRVWRLQQVACQHSTNQRRQCCTVVPCSSATGLDGYTDKPQPQSDSNSTSMRDVWEEQTSFQTDSQTAGTIVSPALSAVATGDQAQAKGENTIEHQSSQSEEQDDKSRQQRVVSKAQVKAQGGPFDRMMMDQAKHSMHINDPVTYNTNSMLMKEGVKLDQLHQFTKPIMLFDLNGTLTIHKKSGGNHKVSKVRPGIEALAKLKDVFHLAGRAGIYTTSTDSTVSQVWELIDETIGLTGNNTIFDRRLMLHRDFTRQIPGHILQQEGEEAHTHYKPMALWFHDLARVILVDDEKFKLAEPERANGLFVPTWQEGTTSPLVLQTLAVRLARLGEAVAAGKVDDVRPFLRRFSGELIQASQMRSGVAAPTRQVRATRPQQQGTRA